ncbi:MAG TPA: D-glycerate dehydrogenase [Gemmatimonadales bacterium]|nr:D-glycerate dehydrogenase [Gemmatimonadales bacterium]
MTNRPTVIVTRRLPERVEAELARDFDVRRNADDHPFTRDELAAALRQADGVLCTVTDRIDAAVLAAAPLRARILANFGVGYNHIDVAAARARGLVVTNTPGVLTDATADLAILLLLMVARRAGEGEREVRAGAWTGWRPTHLLGHMVSGRTLGIVGYGRIGRATARRAAHGFGMRVLIHTPRPPAADALAADGVAAALPLDELLAASDFVSLHCPATPATRHLIDARRLALMRRDAYLVNTARGDVVDEAALVAALREGRIAGAGLDVYEREPALAAGLAELENVVLLPHLGSATLETREAMGMRAVTNLRNYFRGGEALDRV